MLCDVNRDTESTYPKAQILQGRQSRRADEAGRLPAADPHVALKLARHWHTWLANVDHSYNDNAL